MRFRMTAIIAFWGIASFAPPVVKMQRAEEDADFLGRWDITVPGKDGVQPHFCWLEVTREGTVLKGRFNSGGGAQFPLTEIGVQSGELRFHYTQGRPPNEVKVSWKAVAKGGKLDGTADLGKEGTRTWTGVRCPIWPKDLPARKAGKPIALFNGKDISNWLGQIPGKELGWSVQDGVLVNIGANANNIYTKQRFQDFRLEVEFTVDPKSNSGVYLRGRYEIQIMDQADRPLDVHSAGSLYGFVIPSVNAGLPAGQWQKFEITLIANRVTVVLNGKKLMDNAEVPGITGGALDAREGEPGPVMIQGDHGRVQFRKIELTPLT
jgi:hypothetical protein